MAFILPVDEFLVVEIAKRVNELVDEKLSFRDG